VVCMVVQYSDEAVEWLNVDEGLSIAITKEGKNVYLMLDWELEWTHK